MNGNMKRGMAEATRLTRAGKLTEATAVIQRTLAGGRAPARRGRLAKVTRAAKNVAGERVRSVRTVEAPKATPSRAVGSSFADASYSGPAGSRKYKVYLPAGYTGAPVPLVVMLHGGTQSVEDFAAATRMNALAERNTFLVAYPEQSKSANQMKFWNWFQPGNQRRGRGEPAIIAGITRAIIKKYAVDTDRVYVAGFSAGGAMAAVMAATYADLYAAAGVHSGVAYGSAHDVGSAFSVMKNGPSQGVQLPGAAVPLIVFHGDRDQTVDQVNASRLVDQWRSTTPRSARGAGADSKTVHRAPVQGGRSSTKRLFHDAQGAVTLEEWIVHGGGHAWFGGRAQGSYTDPLGPDASAEMTRFFAEHGK